MALTTLSQFEKDVLQALIQGDPEEDVLRAQLAQALVIKRDYTGVGLYTDICIPEGSPLLKASHRLIENTPKAHLTHPSLAAGAGAILWHKDGRISTLECYAYDGDWPKDESSFVIEKAK